MSQTNPPDPHRASHASAPTLESAQRVLVETARQLGSSLEPEAIFTRLKDSVCDAMACDGLIVSSFDAREGLIRCAYAWVGGNVLDPAALPPLVYRPDAEGMQTQVLRTGRPMLFSDVSERVRDPQGTFYEVEPSGEVRDLRRGPPTGSRSAIMTPLLLEGDVTGVVQVMTDREGAYTETDLELLEGISLLLAVALENAALYRRSKEELLERNRTEGVLREAEERYRAFVTNSTEGIYRIELAVPIDISLPVEDQARLAYAYGVIAECNDAFARMYGYERSEDMIGFGLDRLLPVDDPVRWRHLCRVVEAGYSVTDDESAEFDRDGNPVWFSNNFAGVVENGRLLRIWGTQSDISERHRNEQALREADRRKDEFLATLGHELRNPLNPIRSAVELLRLKGTTDPDVSWSHDVIQRQVVHLARLIDDLLDVSRITQGKLELRRETIELGAFLDGVIAAAGPAIGETDRSLTLQPPGGPLHVDGDPVRLAQVLSNLLDNAAKYTRPGGRITVGAAGRGDAVTIFVEDDGKGLSAEHLPHVFDLFYQADRSPDHSRGGLGLGLTLVKQLVEMHGGSIAVASDGPDRGSRFTIRLPAQAASTPAPEPARPDATPAARPRRILVADDNRDSADSMAMLLRLGGNEVVVAYDGEEAVRSAEEFRPDVLLLDIGMPRLNGYEVAKQVRAMPWGRDALLIAATGWGQEEDRRRSMDTGFNAHLVKPVDHGALVALLRNHSS